LAGLVLVVVGAERTTGICTCPPLSRRPSGSAWVTGIRGGVGRREGTFLATLYLAYLGASIAAAAH
jgi:hypothetical protein